MRDLIEHDPYPVVLFHPSGAIQYANEAARQMARGGQTDVLSGLLSKPIAAAMCAAGAAMMDRSADPRESSEMTVSLPDGQRVLAAISVRAAAPEAPLVLRIRPAASVDESATLLR